MKIWSGRMAAVAVGVVLAACGAATGGPAPGTTQPAPAQPTAGGADRAYTEADVRFMQGMILHHRQAVEMVDLVPERTDSEDILRLAERIDVSQRDEMAMMERWLRERGEAVPAAGAQHHQHGAGADHAPAPGMLTPEEMAQLAAARGLAFERLFLRGMIRHHEGALVMVDALFGTQGAGQGSEIYQIAEGIAGDQQIEIQRMYRLLAARQ